MDGIKIDTSAEYGDFQFYISDAPVVETFEYEVTSDDTTTVDYVSDDNQLRCRFGDCNFSIMVQHADVDGAISQLDRPEDRRLKNRLANLDKEQYVEFINHIKEHLVQSFTADNQMSIENAKVLMHYEIHDYEKWAEYVADEEINRKITQIMPYCNWLFDGEEGLDYCSHEFTDLLDLLTHYYYHTHQARLENLGASICAENTEMPQCGQTANHPSNGYLEYKKQYNIVCKWVNQTAQSSCQYACFIPEFMEKHLLNEIDNYWLPNLWKKDRMLTCNWEGCQFVVRTHAKGSRPMQRLKDHLKIHLQLKLFACPGCSIRFSNKTRFCDHFFRQELDRRWQCDVCKKMFQTNRILREHQRNHVRQYDCPHEDCEHRSANFASLSKHLIYCHSDARKFGPCPFCQKMSKSRTDYKKHVLTHNKSRQVIKCKYDNCNFETMQSTQIHYHYRMKHLSDGNGEHTSSKGYRCHFCLKVYSRGFKLSEHFRKEHGDQDERFKQTLNNKNVRLTYRIDATGYYKLSDDSYDNKKCMKINLENKIITVDYEKSETNKNTEEEPGIVEISDIPKIAKETQSYFECDYCKTLFRRERSYLCHREECDLAPDSRFQKIISGNLSPKMVEFNPENSVTSESPHDDIVVLEQVPENTDFSMNIDHRNENEEIQNTVYATDNESISIKSDNLTEDKSDEIEKMKVNLPENAELICTNDGMFVKITLPNGEIKVFKANKNK